MTDEIFGKKGEKLRSAYMFHQLSRILLRFSKKQMTVELLKKFNRILLTIRVVKAADLN